MSDKKLRTHTNTAISTVLREILCETFIEYEGQSLVDGSEYIVLCHGKYNKEGVMLLVSGRYHKASDRVLFVESDSQHYFERSSIKFICGNK